MSSQRYDVRPSPLWREGGRRPDEVTPDAPSAIPSATLSRTALATLEAQRATEYLSAKASAKVDLSAIARKATAEALQRRLVRPRTRPIRPHPM